MRWTSKGVAGLPAWRERVEEGERIVDEAGGKLVGVYGAVGRFDVVEIFEAPDDDTAAEILMKLQRHGAEHTETLRAFTRDEAEAIVRRRSAMYATDMPQGQSLGADGTSRDSAVPRRTVRTGHGRRTVPPTWPERTCALGGPAFRDRLEALADLLGAVAEVVQAR